MFTFAYPGLLFLLLLIPFFTVLYVLSRYVRKKRIKRFGNPKYVNDLMPELSPYKSNIRFTVAMLALASIIIALARPWGGIKNQETSREGIEIVIAVDASNSMRASATGDENGPDRMRTAKLMLEKLISRMSNDRVGLIAYAGDAYTLIPVTNDYVSAKAFLNSIDPSLIPHQGTNIGAAVHLAENSFSERGDVGKAIILLTDAEELEDSQGAINAVRQAAKRGIQTDVIGIGSSPVTIPSPEQGRMIDEETGEVVRSALNEDLALEIAKIGKGIYVNASNDEAVDELTKQLGSLKKAALEASFLVTHDELYFPFVIFAIVMLIADFIITDKKNRWLDKINFFNKSTIIITAIIGGFMLLSSCGKRGEDTGENAVDTTLTQEKKDSLKSVYSYPKEYEAIVEGNELQRAGNLEKADSAYTEAINVNQRSAVAGYNKGVNYLRMMEALIQQTPQEQLSDSLLTPFMQNAVASLNMASSLGVKKSNVSSMAFYNQGNVSFASEDYQSAIDLYKDALRLNPDDDKARRNLKIAQDKKKEQDKNQNQNQNQNKNQNQDQNQQQQNQNQNQQQQNQEQDRQQINNQTSDQILNAADRKENERRIKMQTQKHKETENGGRSNKRW